MDAPGVAPLDRLDAAVDRLESSNAAALAMGRQRRRNHLHELLEAIMAATDPLEDALSRDEADMTALEASQAAVHAHVQELRAIAQALRSTRADEAARLTSLADRMEAATAAGAGDASEPAAEPAPAP